MLSVPTGSTTVLQRSGGRLRRIRTYQLRFPPVETHAGARRSNGHPDVAQEEAGRGSCLSGRWTSPSDGTSLFSVIRP
jgi:hypothetical protein